MKKIVVASVILSVLFLVGCQREIIAHDGGVTTNKNLTSVGLRIASKVDGVIICEVPDEDLGAAIEDYFNGENAQHPHMVDLPGGTMTLEGELTKANKTIKYAFEVIPVGDVFYLPITGTEQHIFTKSNCDLVVYSVNSGTCSCGNCKYSAQTSSKENHPYGTNGLVQEILERIN